ncbi:hypothetical protein GLP37_20635 [Photobacterium phosphoreum]|uniref:hypothetical protein n=1 Tax=Photobacterium phosphoreum TaxID=659 RepID=UPI001E585E5D|nr:hypothetical protein [Photobacterium phosphoreum]MCD9504573.1 hypothetical protein [Photobacterium phosphoreum]
MNIDGIAVRGNDNLPQYLKAEPYYSTPLSYFQFKNKIDRENMYQKTTDEYIAEYITYLNEFQNKGI